jgi:hypothetical protein
MRSVIDVCRPPNSLFTCKKREHYMIYHRSSPRYPDARRDIRFSPRYPIFAAISDIRIDAFTKPTRRRAPKRKDPDL